MIQIDEDTALLEHLLDLDGFTIEVGGGYWAAFRARRVPPDAGRPHGIQYAMSLHGPQGKRLLGYDNAHAPPARAAPSGKSVIPLAYDHVHKGQRVLSYQFCSPGQLVEDFWADVEATLKEEGIT